MEYRMLSPVEEAEASSTEVKVLYTSLSLGMISAAARMRQLLICCSSCCLDGSLAVSTADAVSFNNVAVFLRMCKTVIRLN